MAFVRDVMRASINDGSIENPRVASSGANTGTPPASALQVDELLTAERGGPACHAIAFLG